MIDTRYTALFAFCGLGAVTRGFLDAEVHVAGRRARFVSLGGIDNDPEACKDFEYLTESPALCADIAKLVPADLRAFAGGKAPDVVFISAPCKGASKLISNEKASDPRYQALNRLALNWVELMLSTWDAPPRLVFFENVPNLTVEAHAKKMLAEVKRLLRGAGYLLSDGYHDCGELGGLAQHRRRWLMVARHARRVPPLLYQPPKRRVRGCGEVLGKLPMPGDPAAGELHKIPRISWLNWVRLALIPAGGDWRDLPGVLEDGQPRREVFRRHHVGRWSEPAATVGGSGSNGPCAVADPRAPDWFKGVLGVTPWRDPSGAVTGRAAPTTGAFSVADPRLNKRCFDHGYRVLGWDEASFTVAGQSLPGCGAYSVADPRIDELDVSLGCAPRAGAYGVIPWTEAAKTVTGAACIDNGAFAVADPRTPDMPPAIVIHDVRKPPSAVPVIIAADGTWHQPLTTLELAVLQGLPAKMRGAPLALAGESVSRWRERIGNAIPPPTAEAIARVGLCTLVQADTASFGLSAGAVWVDRPHAAH